MNCNSLNNLQKSLDQISIEKPSKISLFLNKAIALLMNNYPTFANTILSHSKSDLAHYLFHDPTCPKGSFKQLNEIYDYEYGKKGDILNRIINLSPALKAARNRKKIAQQFLRLVIAKAYKNPTVIFSFGGGDSRIEIEVMAEMDMKNLYLISIDAQTEAKVEGEKLAKKLNIINQVCFITEFVSFN